MYKYNPLTVSNKDRIEDILRRTGFEEFETPDVFVEYESLFPEDHFMKVIEVYSFYDSRGNFEKGYMRSQKLRENKASNILRKINSSKYDNSPLEHSGICFRLNLRDGDPVAASQHKIRHLLVKGPKGDETAISPSMSAYITPRTLKRRFSLN